MMATGSGSATRGDQVEAAGPSAPLDEPIHQALHRVAHRLDHARRERLGHQPSNPRVVGRLHVQDAVRDEVPERVVLRRRGRVPHLLVRGEMEVGATEAPIPQEGVHVLVAGHQPQIEGLVVEHRGAIAELAVDGIRVGDEAGVGGMEAHVHPPTVASGHVVWSDGSASPDS